MGRIALKTGDRIKLGIVPFHWAHHLQQENTTESNPLFLKDLFLPKGYVNWRDYRYILLLLLGAIITIPIAVPAIIFFTEEELKHRGIESPAYMNPILLSELIIWLMGLLGAYVFLNLTQKMIREQFRNKPEKRSIL